jgi:hypothetical protein
VPHFKTRKRTRLLPLPPPDDIPMQKGHSLPIGLPSLTGDNSYPNINKVTYRPTPTPPNNPPTHPLQQTTHRPTPCAQQSTNLPPAPYSTQRAPCRRKGIKWREPRKSTFCRRKHGHTARGGHGLPKVSLGPAIPYHSTPCRQATSETTLWPFEGSPARRSGGLRPFSTHLDTPRRTPLKGNARKS